MEKQDTEDRLRACMIGGSGSGWQAGRQAGRTGPSFPHHGHPCNVSRHKLREGKGGREGGDGWGIDSGLAYERE